LGAAILHFAHEALLVGSEGKLSKRLGSLGVDSMREAGIEPIALVAKLARIGTSLPVEPVSSVEPLAESFDFATFGRAPARFDLEELAALNARIVHLLAFDAVAARLPEGMSREAWEAIRPNIRTIEEAADWWHVIEGPVESISADEDRRFLAQASEAAAGLDWSDNPWSQLTAALKQGSGRTGKQLFLPLRKALTGRESGPEMAPLLLLIGKERAVERLKEAAEQ
jgi:glutamyl-tRNA synthetase